jgi:hypothetical protein
VAETLLHDQLPENGGFDVAHSQFTGKYFVRFATATAGVVLALADLTGHSLKRATLLLIRPSGPTPKLAAANLTVPQLPRLFMTSSASISFVRSHNKSSSTITNQSYMTLTESCS